VFTDSTVDLPSEHIEKYQIGLVPLYVIVDGKSYLDGIEMKPDSLYKIIEETSILPKTSAATIGDFTNAFAPYIDEGYDIVYMGLSSQLSATFQSAVLAAKELDEGRVHVIDSQNLSTGIGLQVLKAAEMALAGSDASDIVKAITAIVPKVRASFILNTLKFLHMGGRCSSIKLLATNVFKIHPQIIVKDGGMVVGAKFRGKWKACLKDYYDLTVGDGTHIDADRVFITHTSNPEAAKYFKQRIEDELDIKDIIVTEAGTVIASHCGPGTIGILYIEK
ncbi:MAG TPA: DegV family protein, partial [Bacillota bacterium]|nr:DegV family protein [Bacillota bacterium]